MAGIDRELPRAGAPKSLFLCCWCRIVFRDGRRAVGAEENYGICPSCLEAALAALASEPLARSA